MSVDFPDYQEPAKIATSIGATDLTATGLAKELGGNLATHTALLNGTQAGALIAAAGRTVGQEVAALIASGSAAGVPGGTPLLHGTAQVFNLANQVIAASGVFTTANITFTKPGYLIRISAQMSAVNAAVPFMSCNLQWSYSGNPTVVLAQEKWFVNCGSAGAIRTNGKGPTKADTLAITFTNGDAVASVTVSVTVAETTQHIARDDWRNAVGAPSATAAAAVGDPLANILASDSFNVGAGASVGRNMALYAGPVSIWINQIAGVGSTVSIFPTGDFALVTPNPVTQLDWTAAPFQLKQAYLPRCPCQVLAANGSGAAGTLNVVVTALENAS